MTNDNALDLLRRLDPVAIDDPAAGVRPESRADLLHGITETDLPVARKGRRRTVMVLVAAATVAVLSVGALQIPDGKGGQQPVLGPALAFATEGKVLKIRVLDAQAEAARYNQELKAHGLNITLKLQAASPSLVGAQLSTGIAFADPKPLPEPRVGEKRAFDDPFKTTVYPADCRQRHVPCTPEFTVPLDYKDTATLVFGREAKPGERYLAAGEIGGRGEVLEGVPYKGRSVGYVTQLLAKRGYSVEYLQDGTYDTPVRKPTPKATVAVGLAASDHHVRLFVRQR